MNDPFELLRVYEGFEAAAISSAFAAAIARGVPVMEARQAMDILRDPTRRSAAAVLAPSMARSVQRRRSAAVAPVDSDALGIVLRAVGSALDDLDAVTRLGAVVPSRAHLVDEALPPLPDHLAP